MRNAVTIAACCLLFAAAAGAKGVDENTLLLLPAFWKCTQPPDVLCMADASAPEQMEKCKRCEKWDMFQSVTPRLGDALDPAKYKTYSENANVFVKDILVGLYGLSPFQAEAMVPHKINLLYENPRRFGWIELSEAIPGALVIDRKKATLVLPTEEELKKATTSPTPPPPPLKPATKQPTAPATTVGDVIRYVLYPSAKRQGALWSELLSDLFGGEEDGEAKVVLPFAAPPERAAERLDTPPLPEEDVLYWNTWIAAREGKRYEPLYFLPPNGTYDMYVHLAPILYEKLYGVMASREVQQHLRYLAERTSASEADLKAVVVTDAAMLQTEQAAFDFSVNLDRFNKWVASPEGLVGDPLKYLAHGGKPSFVFAEVPITLRSTSRKGPTRIGLSIWGPDGLPIDGLSIPICIADTELESRGLCGARQPRGKGGAGFQFGQIHPTPDAALHMIGLGSTGVAGIFRDNTSDDAPFFTWRLSPRESDLIRDVETLVEQFGENRDDPSELAMIGHRLYDILFAQSESSNVSAGTARAAFEKFITPYFVDKPASGKEAPLLFARLLQEGSVEQDPTRRRAVNIPLGLLNLGDECFLGFHARVELPLGNRRYEPSQTADCVSRWRLVVPPARSADFGRSRKRLNDLVPGWMQRAKLVERMDHFRDYLSDRAEEKDATALVVMSHFGARDDRLTFDGKYVAAKQIKRKFAQPSIAVLNGCGTAEPGSPTLINVLNDHGVETIVASSHVVRKEMAVDFFGCLSKFISDSGPDVRTLSQAHFDALLCLRDTRPAAQEKPYGAAALAYNVIGNGAMSLCNPANEKEESGETDR